MAESGGALPEKEDRISALPDCLIHRILSFLPSTKQAIQTGILSKRWRNQWTLVSTLIFDFSGMYSHDTLENVSRIASTVSRIIDHTLSLHEFPKIHKFHITADRLYDTNFEENVRFAVRKQAEEIILKFSVLSGFRLPEFFFAQPSLTELQLCGCSIEPTGMVNWKSLKDLCIYYCSCTCEMIMGIVSGSPLLRSLELEYNLDWNDRLVIASNSLKKLALFGFRYVAILCPNLVEFCGVSSHYPCFPLCEKELEKFVSESSSLETLELKKFKFSDLRIASKILKKLVLSIEISKEIEIECPRLDELDLSGCVRTIRVMNLPSSVCASLNLLCNNNGTFFLNKNNYGTLAEQILGQLWHLTDLKLGNSFLSSLSNLEKYGISHTFLKCKSLTLDFEFDSSYLNSPGIAYALRSSPVLETLVVKLHPRKNQRRRAFISQSAHPWQSKGTHLSSLLPCLRTFKITGFSQCEYNRQAVLNFVKFVLEYASALEKMVVVLEDCGTDFVTEVSQKLLSFPRCSDVIIDLQCPK